MIDAKHWRWPLVLGLPLVVGGALAFGGVIQLVFEGEARLALAGEAAQMDRDLTLFRSEESRKRLTLALLRPAVPVRYEKVPGHPLEIAIRGQAAWPGDVVDLLAAASKISAHQAFVRQKADIHKELDARRKDLSGLQPGLDQLALEKRALLAGSKRPAPRPGVAEKIQALKTRRQFLIEHYPTHTDILALAQQIKELQNEWSARSSRSGLSPRKISELARRTNEARVRFQYFSRCIDELSQGEKDLKPGWTLIQPVQKPSRPSRVEGWPLFSGILAGVFILALVVFRGKSEPRAAESTNGLWRPQAADEPSAPDVVTLEVVPVEAPAPPAVEPSETLPSDPLTAQAAALYAKWIEVATALYTPAPEAPQGVLDQVGPLLEESSDFLPQGHDALARYLAQTVLPGNLPAHVARTVLMTLTGAQDAGVTPEHRLAMTLAALFHDLAMVPRLPAGRQVPAEGWADVGSEVGRLSASVLKRIPGLGPAILSMVEDILIGMDEFKLATWQNAAMEKTLEPLSKVLREIDRFEKVMQKQRARLDRQITHRKAS